MLSKPIKECCGNCISYLTDEDKNGNITDFHHDRDKKDGFCALRDLFYDVRHDTKPCDSWVYDGGVDIDSSSST